MPPTRTVMAFAAQLSVRPVRRAAKATTASCVKMAAAAGGNRWGAVRIPPAGAFAATSRRLRTDPPLCRPARLHSVRMALKAESVTDDTFEAEVLQSSQPVLVDFYATWCGPCKLIAPLIDWAASEFAGKLKVFKFNTDENPKHVRDYNIYGLPTLVIFRDGQVVAQHEGALGKGPLTQFLAKHLPDLVPSGGPAS